MPLFVVTAYARARERTESKLYRFALKSGTETSAADGVAIYKN